MRLVLTMICLLFCLTAWCQNDLSARQADDTPLLKTNDGELLRFSHIDFNMEPEKPLSMALFSSCQLKAPDKLPMFCEMEKRLIKATKVWMMFRLESNDNYNHFNTYQYRPEQ